MKTGIKGYLITVLRQYNGLWWLSAVVSRVPALQCTLVSYREISITQLIFKRRVVNTDSSLMAGEVNHFKQQLIVHCEFRTIHHLKSSGQ